LLLTFILIGIVAFYLVHSSYRKYE